MYRSNQSAYLQFLDQETSHYGLTSPGVVGKKKTNAGHFQEVVINRFKLVRQRIHSRNREAEIRVVLVGQAQSHCLNTEAKSGGIAIEGLLFGDYMDDLTNPL